MAMASINEHERQINALWAKYEDLKKQFEAEKLENVRWKTEVATKLVTKNDILERWIWATFVVTALAFVGIIIQFAFDFIKKGGF